MPSSCRVILGLIVLLLASGAAASGLPEARFEHPLLVGAPGSSGSVAAGLFNPAAWALEPGGFFLSYTDPEGSRPGDWAGVLSLRHLGFGVRHRGGQDALGDFGIEDYTLGLSFGDRGHAWGLSYAWGGGDLDRSPRHERLMLGSVWRSRFLSLGATGILDLDVDAQRLQADVALRPWGPRLTLFADAAWDPDEALEEAHGAVGLEIRATPGLQLAGRLEEGGAFGLRVSFGLMPGVAGSVRGGFDEDGDHGSTTFVLESVAEMPALTDPLRPVGGGVAEFSFRGGLGYRRYKYLDSTPTLLSTLARIERAATDPSVGTLLVNLSGMRIAAEGLWELREQLAGARALGKSVVIYADRLGMFGTMLASVADELWLDPQGHLQILGLAFGRTFYRGTLDKLGVGVDEWRFFTFKSAFEALSRTGMSEPDREQRLALLDSFYDGIAQTITTSRGIDRAAWDAAIDEKGRLLPQEALSIGLVDSVGTWAEARASAARRPKRSTADVSSASLAGLMGDHRWEPQQWGRPPRIALLYAIGECDMDTGIQGRRLARWIEAAGKDPGIEAVVLRADSPGGDPLPSDLVARALREAAERKPVIVSQGTYAASGGYWISMYGDSILASPYTITGSIGIIAGWIWNEGIGDKMGFTYDGVHRGAHADGLRGITFPFVRRTLPDRPLTSEERERVEQTMRLMYDDFVQKVAEGRGMDPEAVDAIGQGRVWSGAQGLENGLVDELGGLWLALQLAKEAAGIPAERRIDIVEGPDLGLVPWNRLARRFSPLPIGAPVVEAVAEESVTGWLSPEDEAYLRALLESPGLPLVRMPPLRIDDGAPVR